MIVRFDLERRHVPAADVDDPGVLARPLDDQLSARRQFLQVQPRALIRAVLAPHHAENAELRIGRFAPENSDDFVVLRPGQLMRGDQLGRDGGHACANAATMDLNTTSPSVEPISGSAARSGCGIIPITLRSRLSTPAMSRAEPLGLSRYRSTTRSSASSSSSVRSSAT